MVNRSFGKILLVLMLSVGYVIPLQASEKTFLVASDFHFDPFASCSLLENPCPLIETLRHTPAKDWDSLFQQYDKTPLTMGKDSNYALFSSALAEIKKEAQANKALFGLILGDYVGHNLKTKYRLYSADKAATHYTEFVQSLFSYLQLQLHEATPDLTLYHVVGNNDSYNGDYGIESNLDFYSNFMPKSLPKDQIAQAGYYAIDLPSDPHLKLIVLNTNLFSQYAKDPTSLAAANEELEWLKRQLEQLHGHHQRAVMALHIPAGIDVYSSLHKLPQRTIHFWHEADTQKFLQIVAPYSDEVMVILGGHLHKDWFQLIKSAHHKDILISGTPAISPIYQNNPAFKIYHYDETRTELINFSTYFLDLAKSSTWTQEYDFNKVYQTNCAHCAIRSGMQNLTPNGALANQYKLYFAASYPDPDIAKYWQPHYWCAMFNIIPEAYQNCLIDIAK